VKPVATSRHHSLKVAHARNHSVPEAEDGKANVVSLLVVGGNADD